MHGYIWVGSDLVSPRVGEKNLGNCFFLPSLWGSLMQVTLVATSGSLLCQRKLSFGLTRLTGTKTNRDKFFSSKTSIRIFKVCSEFQFATSWIENSIQFFCEEKAKYNRRRIHLNNIPLTSLASKDKLGEKFCQCVYELLYYHLFLPPFKKCQ